MRKHENLVGKKFGRLLVLDFCGKNKHGHLLWNCLCDCGVEKIISGNRLLSSKTKSCGCFRREFNSLPLGEGSINHLMLQYKRSAKNKKLDFDLTKDEFKYLIFSNCFYCGIPPDNKTNAPERNGNIVYSGIDRVDNAVGYTPENSVPCCKVCNYAKRNLSLLDFYNWIRRLSENFTEKTMHSVLEGDTKRRKESDDTSREAICEPMES